MTRYLVRRLLQTIPVIVVITMIQFALINAAPGGPIKAYTLDPNMSEDDIRRLEQQLGLDQPLPIRYVKWIAALIQGDFGYSYFSHQPVLQLITERMPLTLQLNFAALFLSYVIGIPLGVYAALHRGSWLDHITRLSTTLLNAMPNWWLGLLLIIFIADFKLSSGVQLLPTGGYKTLGVDGFDAVDRLRHILLPALVLATDGWLGFARYMRSETLEVLGQDYVRTAQAKGLQHHIVTWRHVMRNAMIPVVTLSSGLLLIFVGGSVAVETIFSWPGMGQLTYTATLQKDYPVSLGVLLISTLLAITGRLIADIAYGWVDPRIVYD